MPRKSWLSSSSKKPGSKRSQSQWFSSSPKFSCFPGRQTSSSCFSSRQVRHDLRDHLIFACHASVTRNDLDVAADYLCRIASDERAWRHALGHHRARADDAFVADLDAGQNDAAGADEAALADPRVKVEPACEVVGQESQPQRQRKFPRRYAIPSGWSCRNARSRKSSPSDRCPFPRISYSRATWPSQIRSAVAEIRSVPTSAFSCLHHQVRPRLENSSSTEL